MIPRLFVDRFSTFVRPLRLTPILLALCCGKPALLRGETIATESCQFRVESSSATLARRASGQAEQIRKKLYEITGQPNQFVTPIRVLFESSELGDDLEDYTYTVDADPGFAALTYTIGATKESGAGSRRLSWPEAVVTSLQYEMANRVRGKKGGGLIAWPAWFLWGATGTADDGTHEQMKELWESKYRRKTYRTLEQIWKTPASVSAEERERIQVLSTWLILELKQLPDGRAKFIELVHQINRGSFSAAAFGEIYKTDFASPAAAERWWTSRLAYFNHGSELASMDFDDTTGRMREILEGGLPEPGIRGLDQKGLDELNELKQELYKLMVAGHPMIHPAVETALNALESARVNDMRRARPSWKNAETILDALRPWRNGINAVLDKQEYLADQEKAKHWLANKGLNE